MNYSGVVVTCQPGKLEQVIDSVNALENAEVHQIDEKKSRFIAVLSAPEVNDEVDSFKAIQDLEGVADVALVVHHFDDCAEIRPIQDTSFLN
jgi:nitrate reductase NapAB chaperone NapD